MKTTIRYLAHQLSSIGMGLLILLLVFATSFSSIVTHEETRPHDQSPNVRSQPPTPTMTYVAAQTRTPNRLIHEKSPYLLQHAFNPVDWYPWGEEAFAKAREENKPIFLSIGYSTCYWCHVMEREAFENEEIADIMNDHFVCIKVDREERPDIDRLYMTALQALSGGGGWPMSMFLTPDLKPFFGGTYFPPVPQQGRMSFPQLLDRIEELWRNNKGRMELSADQVVEHLEKYAEFSPNEINNDVPLTTAYTQLSEIFDANHGGFGNAPKFPRPAALNFLIQYYRQSGSGDALAMVMTTLRAMAAGGMYDHIGGGFHRYAVDAAWRVPHFEKMLYDQAQLASTYLQAFQITGDAMFASVGRDVLAYVIRNLSDAGGGFYSAEDAESALSPGTPDEKEEGTFYLWTKEEILRILGDEAGPMFCTAFGVVDTGNALSDPTGIFSGKNILYRAVSDEGIARTFNRSNQDIGRILSESKEKLFAAREGRARPHRDDKIVTAWNGLMISACARAYQALHDSTYLLAAERAASFIADNLLVNGDLMRRYCDGEARFDGSLQDYAFFIQGLLDLYESGFNLRWLDLAQQLNERQRDLFWNFEGGGFFDSPSQEAHLFLRMRDEYDGAEPTGNSIAALNLLRLGRMTGNDDLREAAAQTISSFGNRLQEQPVAVPQMLIALEWELGVPTEIIVAASPGMPGLAELLSAIHSSFIPNRILLLADGGDGQKRLGDLLPFIKEMKPIDGQPAVYFCQHYACQLPIADPTVVRERLQHMSIQSRK